MSRWLFDAATPEALKPRLEYFAQAALEIAAGTPDQWVDVSASLVRSDLVPQVVSAAAAFSSLPAFVNIGLTFESQGSRIRFIRSA